MPLSPEPQNEQEQVFDIVIDQKRKVLRINDAIQIKGAGFNLLNTLATAFLQGAGQGLDLLDFPTLDAGKLAVGAGLQDDAAVRQSISRTRTLLGTKFTSAGLDCEDGKDLIENIPWSGYRLRPDRVRVRYVTGS
jgi:DNA-binding winged helix-turn-helix (wHTH) protein